jgi:hypothetical protein
MNRDRELLEKLYGFMLGKNFVSIPDTKALRDMVTRYKQPPLTMHYRVAMQMTVNDYDQIFAILTEIHEYLTPIQKAEEQAAKVDEPT